MTYMTQLYSKVVYIESNAQKELLTFPPTTRKDFVVLIKELKTFGTLQYPESRKLSGYDLFEMRVRKNGAYRCIYYYYKNDIVILSAFKKKTQKTPLREIQKAVRRKINISY